MVENVQVTYGVWKNGEVTEEVGLNYFGSLIDEDSEEYVEPTCDHLDVAEGDFIETVGLDYSTYRVTNSISFGT